MRPAYSAKNARPQKETPFATLSFAQCTTLPSRLPVVHHQPTLQEQIRDESTAMNTHFLTILHSQSRDLSVERGQEEGTGGGRSQRPPRRPKPTREAWPAKWGLQPGQARAAPQRAPTAWRTSGSPRESACLYLPTPPQCLSCRRSRCIRAR